MDRIQELLTKGLANLSADELAELNGLIIAEAGGLADAEHTPETVSALGQLADAMDGLRAEETTRAEQAEAREQAAAAALARINPVAEVEPEPFPNGEELPENTGEPAEPVVEGDRPQPASAPEPAGVAASARRRPSLGEMAAARPAARTVPRAPEGGTTARRSTVRASSNINGYQTGQELATTEELAAAFTTRLKSLDSGSGGPVVVASVAYDFPEDRRLSTDGTANERRVAAVTQPGAITAAGGLCAPVENVYDVPVIGSMSRPVRDALTVFQADRGGVSLRGPSQWTDLLPGVGSWTMAQDTAGTDSKPIVEAICAAFTDYTVDATTLRVRFSNVTTRFDPEMTRANLDLAHIAYASYAENKLLGQIRPFLTPVTTGKVVGATRDILAACDTAIAYYRNRHRLDDAIRLRMIAPRWMRDLIRKDLTRALHTSNLDALAVADQQIDSWFDRRGINITWTLEGRATAQAAGGTGGTAVPAIPAQMFPAATRAAAIPEFPDAIELLLFVEGDLLYLDGGELDLGIVRDSGLNAKNRYEIFEEEFTGVAWRGLEGLQITAAVEPTGGSAGTVDTSAISD